MTDLFSRIETILSDRDQHAVDAYAFSSIPGEEIARQLSYILPTPQGVREHEVFDAFENKRYGQCRIYPQLVDENAFVDAVNLIIDVLEAANSKAATLPTLFKRCAYRITEAQKHAALAEGDAVHADRVAGMTTDKLEKLAIDVFAKGLGDQDELAEQPALTAA